MTTNMGIIDRVGRMAIAAVLLVLALGTNLLGAGVLFWLALVVAGVLAVTAAAGTCPLYDVIGIKTCRS